MDTKQKRKLSFNYLSSHPHTQYTLGNSRGTSVCLCRLAWWLPAKRPLSLSLSLSLTPALWLCQEREQKWQKNTPKPIYNVSSTHTPPSMWMNLWLIRLIRQASPVGFGVRNRVQSVNKYIEFPWAHTHGFHLLSMLPKGASKFGAWQSVIDDNCPCPRKFFSSRECKLNQRGTRVSLIECTFDCFTR